MKRGFFKRIAIALSLINDSTAEEKYETLMKETKHKNLMDDLITIRRLGDYVPDYNKPRLYTEFELVYGDKVVTGNIITMPRPIDFKNDYEKWINAVREDNANEELNRKQKQEAYELFLIKRKENFNKVMNLFTRVE